MAKRVSLKPSQEGIAAELVMLLETVTSDGKINNEEVTELKAWLDANRSANLPGLEFLLTTINQILEDGQITADERKALQLAVEKVLPPELRRTAKERRAAVDLVQKEKKRGEKEQERTERQLRKSLSSFDFLVAGVPYDGRPRAVEKWARVGDCAYLIRDRSNEHDPTPLRSA
jgi:hypothetical protein